mgnify:CR=1 FL=1
MKKAFLETNAICRFFDANTSGIEVRAILESYGYHPVIGLHVIYELSRTFLSGNSDEKAKIMFGILKDLNPIVSETPAAIIMAECNNCFSNFKFNSFLYGAREAETRAEILKLSEGDFDENARRFVISRDKSFKVDNAEIGKRNVEIFLNDPPQKRLRSFDDILDYYTPMIPVLIEQLLPLNNSEASELAAQIDNYPMLKSIVMANLYMVFIAIAHKVTPAPDKTDDHRHVIEASYCDAFITEEKQLLSNIKYINSKLNPIKWSEIGDIPELEDSGN